MNRPDTRGILGATSAALARVAARAAAADAGERDLSEDIADLRRCGLLDRLSHPSDPKAAVTLLRRLGRANLSVGRLAEGHMNALRLIALYGDADQRRRHRADAAKGVLYGVWGADDERPARIEKMEGRRVVLAGGKRFASGLGLVDRSIVSVGGLDGTRLAVVAATDGTRADAGAWRMSGMRATASGTFNLDGLEGELLGAPGDYETEPRFEGGVWRYAALHVGALEAMAEAARQAIRKDQREAQLRRLARLVASAHAARLMVEAAAAAVEAEDARPETVALSLLAREFVETSCLEGIAMVDRALGTRAFATGAAVERIRRDLQLFLRQADLDGKLVRAGALVCQANAPIGEAWGREAPE
ncbi:MAG: cyclic nucleotide-binding protein [Rhodovulum sulfidophilum]|uniref:Cyclic nucleotide-binding protein n=1 Tax=Rhodovulum sulfidophilum TaxID=35806 RepID=A0A2W5PP71_RHOSU|nr:MAG: cyclic nucleotide-binding protein [Rhodovulum sulfidophilum]